MTDDDRRNQRTMPYSVQLYTVRDALATDLPGTIRRLAEIGFTKVEPFDLSNSVDELAEALEKNGVTAPTAHAMLLDLDQDDLFAVAKRLGIETVILPYTSPEIWQTAETIRDLAERLNAAAQKAARYDVRVGYHNHNFEISARMEGTTGLEFFASLLAPEVVLEVDTYWVAIGGEDPAELLERLGDRVIAIHIKDGPTRTPSGELFAADDLGAVTRTQLPAGQGDVDVWRVLGATKALGVVEFDAYSGDIFAGVAASLSYLEAGARVAP